MSDHDLWKESFSKKLPKVRTIEELAVLKSEYIGKTGLITNKFKTLQSLDQKNRIPLAKTLNQSKEYVLDYCNKKQQEIERAQIQKKLSDETIDRTLPVLQSAGASHPISIVTHTILEIFSELGFTLVDGPEIETEENNFTALNIPPHHPARGMHDTFFIKNDMLLRTHTTTMEIRALRSNKPPLQIVTFGKVFRRDSDPTHTPMFHQFEGMRIDKDISFSDLIGILDYFLKIFFEDNSLKTRLRPSYFPFTEPSAEIDVSCFACKQIGCSLCKQSGWIEVLGCGMLHPNLFLNLGSYWRSYQGYAFGMGIERLTLLKFKLNDLRDLYDSDYQVLQQFN